MNDLQMTNQDLSQRQSMEELANQLTLADHLVYKKYLPELQSYSLVEPSEEMKKTLDVKTCIKLFQMKELTLKKGEDMLQKLSTVYHSSMALGCSLAVMIDVPADGAPADIYLGVRQNPGRQSIDNRDLAISGDALEKGMKSNFPGSEVQELHQEEIDALLEDDNGSFGSAQSAIASVSCVAALRDKSKTEDKAFIQGIERFIDAMDGDAYTALFLAEPVTEETQAGIRNGYEELYSALSPFRKTTWSYTENESHAVMETFCSGTSDTVTDGTSSGSLMIGEGSSVESGAVNLWQDRASVTAMREYLKRFTHPVFARQLWENEADSLFYTAGTLVSGRELPMHLGLPTRSVHGLPIIEHAEFGRNVPDEAMPDEDKMNLGKIYHMGKEEAAGLLLNRQAMASHTFITGSTGTGKSNAVYHLLDEITKNGQTTFLVVEPAKGEYKNVFGNCTDVQVFGTNPRETPLLRMNPFAFPENIHILEHIDRLVEIFNACWPMYAAMPAVLKDAIERSYQKVGWDLRNSESEKGVFPTFFDLLDILPGVIEESHYSKDTQSDYVGALCTRVKSLTNGIYGSVLCAEDALSDADMFDQNVIVDLSRVGSMETKSLLMGILVMKLQEYRMCSSGMNSRLRHVTVLEEAHNLLRKTSAEQSQEGANLQGKSVEMLANAIAEMRTYGEGFIIADQAPGLLDMSVIRNTNTKIILRLPDEEDRKLVGKSAALKEAQIDELSKLPLGVAAVYQNEWPEAVLCKIEAYPMPENAVYHKPSKMPHEINAEFVFGQLAVGKELEPLSSSEMEQLKLWLKRHETVLKPEDDRYLERVFAGGELDVAKTRKAVFDFFGGIGTVVDYCAAAKKSLTPRKEFLEQLQGQYGLKAAAADWVLNSVISMGMSLNPDAKAVDNLRTNFEQQGGRVL